MCILYILPHKHTENLTRNHPHVPQNPNWMKLLVFLDQQLKVKCLCFLQNITEQLKPWIFYLHS